MLSAGRDALVVGLRLLRPRHDQLPPLLQLLVRRLQRDSLVGGLQGTVEDMNLAIVTILIFGSIPYVRSKLPKPLVPCEGLTAKLDRLPVLRFRAVVDVLPVGKPLVVLLQRPGVIVVLYLPAGFLQDSDLPVLLGLPLLRPVLLLPELLVGVGVELRRSPPGCCKFKRLVEVLLLVGRAHLVDLVPHLVIVLSPAVAQLLVCRRDRGVVTVEVRGDDQLLLGVGKLVLVHQLFRLADLLVDRLLLLPERLGRRGRLLVGRVELRRLLGVLDGPVVVPLADLALGIGDLRLRIGDIFRLLLSCGNRFTADGGGQGAAAAP